MKKLTTLIILSLFVFSCQKQEEQRPLVSPIFHGDEVGNGGDQNTIHFRTVARDILQLIIENQSHDSLKVEAPKSLNIEKLKDIILEQNGSSYIVISTDEILFDKNDQQKEALNFPRGKDITSPPFVNISDKDQLKPLIVLNQSAWSNHIKNKTDLSMLVFHELAPLADVLDDNGEISQFLRKIIRQKNYMSALETNGHRVMTMPPQSGSLGSILEDIELVEGIIELEKNLLARTQREAILGTILLTTDIYNVDKMRGYYRFYKSEESLKRTFTFAYPVEVENQDGTITTQYVLEIKKNDFSKMKLRERILHTFVAFLYLKESEFNHSEMEKLIDLAIEITNCQTGEMLNLCWEAEVTYN